MRRAAKIDANQPRIVRALRQIPGVTVTSIGQPVDLVIGYEGRNYLIEIKNSRGRNQLKPRQIEFIETWTGQVAVCHTLGDVLKAINIVWSCAIDDIVDRYA